MENKIREERSVDVIIDAKERAIINLYAEQNHLNEVIAESVYFCSKLKNIIRDKESGLYLESPYYILERYSEYMAPANLDINIDNTGIYSGAAYSARLKNDGLIADPMLPYYASSALRLHPILFELVTVQAAHYFAQLEQYKLIRENSRLNSNISGINHIIIAGNPEVGKTTLASMLADRFREFGMVSKGNLVEITKDGLVGQWLETDNQSVDKILLMIVAEYADEMEDFWRGNPNLKNNFTNIAYYKKNSPKEMVTISKSHYSKKEGSLALKGSAYLKDILKAL